MVLCGSFSSDRADSRMTVWLSVAISLISIGRRIGLKQTLRGAHDLLRRHRAAGLAAHAIGQHEQGASRQARAGEDAHPVLLFAAITDVLRSTGCQFETFRCHDLGCSGKIKNQRRRADVWSKADARSVPVQ